MAKRKNILIIEDEDSIRQLITFSLKEKHCIFSEAENLQCAYKLLNKALPDLIILDWMLPDGNGISLLQQLRTQHDALHIPVLMLTARSAESDIIKGLDSGADDYLTKPFSIAELKARINALLRRSKTHNDEMTNVLEWEGITVNNDSYEVSHHNNKIKLHRREFQLLKVFLTQPGVVHEREQLISRVWGDFAEVGDRVVDVAVRRLRKAFSEKGCELPISTIRGVGYRLDRP